MNVNQLCPKYTQDTYCHKYLPFISYLNRCHFMYVQGQCLLPVYNCVAEDSCSFLRALVCLSNVLEEFLHFYKQC